MAAASPPSSGRWTRGRELLAHPLRHPAWLWSRDWALILLAGVIGILMSGVAMAFILPLRWLETQFQGLAGQDMRAAVVLVMVTPIVGALLCGAVRWLFPHHMPLSGVSAVMYSIHRTQSRLPLWVGIEKWMASTCTIGSGGSAGPEGPIVTIGSAIGSSIGQRLKVPPTVMGSVLGAAAAAGLASVFNAPFAGIFFVLEVLLRDFSLRTFTPVVIAAVVSSATTQAALGDVPLFGVDPALFTARDKAFTLKQIPSYLLLGAACGGFGVLFNRGLARAERAFERIPVSITLRPACGATLLGLLGVGTLLLVGRPELPSFYGNGYEAIAHLLSPEWHTARGSEADRVGGATLMLLGILVAKAVATWFTLGSRGSGGLFAPGLLLGAALGGAAGHALQDAGWTTASPAHYALIGMAGMIAATTHAPLTAILLVYEITRSYEMILPLMLAATVATIAARLLFPESVYTAKLASMGITMGGLRDLPVLRRLVATDVPLFDAVIVHPDESAERLVALTERTGVADFVVADRDGRYLGMVTGVDLRQILVYREAMPLMQVEEMTRRDIPTVSPDDTLDIVLGKFASKDVQCLTVLGEGEPARILGVLGRSRVLRRYQQSLDE